MSRAIVIHSDIMAGVMALPREQAGELFQAAGRWQAGEEPVIETAAVLPWWTMMRAKLTEYDTRYEKMCDKRRTAGRKGGVRSGAVRSKKQIEASASEVKQEGLELSNAKQNEQNQNQNQNQNQILLRSSATVVASVFDQWFDEVFWKAYPRKVSKPQAKRAAKNAWKRVSADVIMETLAAAREEDHRFREREFTPHPASWLNSDPWGNEEGEKDEGGRMKAEGGRSNQGWNGGEKNQKSAAAGELLIGMPPEGAE